MSLLGSIGLVCLLLGTLDIVTSLLGVPLSSNGWSPIVLFLLAAVLFTLESVGGRDRLDPWDA